MLPYSSQPTEQHKSKILQVTNTVVVPQKNCASLLFSTDRTAQVKGITGYKHGSRPSENLCFLTLLSRQNSTSQRHYKHGSRPSENLCFLTLLSRQNSTRQRYYRLQKHGSSPSENLCFLTLLSRQNSTSQRHYMSQKL